MSIHPYMNYPNSDRNISKVAVDSTTDSIDFTSRYERKMSPRPFFPLLTFSRRPAISLRQKCEKTRVYRRVRVSHYVAQCGPRDAAGGTESGGQEHPSSFAQSPPDLTTSHTSTPCSCMHTTHICILSLFSPN